MSPSGLAQPLSAEPGESTGGFLGQVGLHCQWPGFTVGQGEGGVGHPRRGVLQVAGESMQWCDMASRDTRRSRRSPFLYHGESQGQKMCPGWAPVVTEASQHVPLTPHTRSLAWDPSEPVAPLPSPSDGPRDSHTPHPSLWTRGLSRCRPLYRTSPLTRLWAPDTMSTALPPCRIELEPSRSPWEPRLYQSTILANLNRANFTFWWPKLSRTPPKWIFFAFCADI